MGECFELMRLAELHKKIVFLSIFVAAFGVIVLFSCLFKRNLVGFWVGISLLVISAVINIIASPNTYQSQANMCIINSG